ncbi:hypothetical protein [Thauera sp. SDU_THAU2]|uniref:hypothetical protein n=1 Tax=Thauera sp. SDU_THAU2 TaxID=3136633 RepID=UPI003120171C
MTRFRWIARLFPAAVVCLSLTGCLLVPDKAGLARNIARDPALIGEWEVLQWFSSGDGSYKGSDRFFRIEERLHDGKHVYEIVSKNPHFKAHTKDFFAVHRFGDNRYVLNGRPENCETDGGRCRLLQYLLTEDGNTLGIMVLNPKAAAAHLSRMHPKRDKITYPPQTGDVHIKVLDDEVKSVLSDGMLGSMAWESRAILLRVR